MSVKTTEISIPLETPTIDLLVNLAKQEHKSLEIFAKELILDALELREDLSLSAIAELRDQEGVKQVSHDDAWR